ncbi:hypothetical protein [Vibrio navarrensis]|uniref:Uncharacterized protein n=1 Tax=Vibrio navarrensis TaxID=29495 RepID=A0A099LPB1_9VIBR|nr:hypothetical protein [Vibrio navarrensis]KGK10063.1 hypothetical protein EA26_01545 [Vibrio navarrensis]MBE4615439.1 hypothetical protein [Vibrio navarrensis]QOD69946.1 hypothetical protein IF132_14475 [Vibrio navarrensis]
MGSPSDEARRGEQAEDRGKLDRALDRSRGRSGEGVAQRQAALGTTHSTWTYGTNEDFAAGFSARMSPEEFNEFFTDMAMLAAPGASLGLVARLGLSLRTTVAASGIGYTGYVGNSFSLLDDAVKAINKIEPEKLKHIFDQEKHKLGKFLDKFDGDQERAFRAIDDAAQEALVNGALDTSKKINRVNVGGMEVDLVGGKVVDGRFRIGSASRRDIEE